ncbi:hypothetical protein GVAV_000705 [Gurleya vavrai]
MRRPIKKKTKKIIKKFLTADIFEEFNTYVNSDLRVKLQSELSEVAVEIAKSCPPLNLYAQTEARCQILKSIIDLYENNLYKKDLKAISAMFDYIDNDKNMSFFRYMECYFLNYESSNSPIYFEHIRKVFYEINDNVIITINLLFENKNFNVFLIDLLYKKMLFVLESEEYVILDEICKNFDLDIDQIFEKIENDMIKSDNANIHDSLKNIQESSGNYKYRASYADSDYRKNFIKHFKFFNLTLLKLIYRKTIELKYSYTSLFITKAENLKNLIDNNYESFKYQIKLEMISLLKNSEKIHTPFFEKLNDEFKPKEIINVSTIRTIKNVLIAESFIQWNRNRFFNNYLQEELNNGHYGLEDLNETIEKITNKRCDDKFRLKKFIDHIKESKQIQSFDKNTNNETMSSLCDVPVNIILSIYIDNVISIYERYQQFLEDFKDSKVHLVYDYFNFKNLLFKELDKPIEKNSKNYHTISFLLKRICFSNDYYEISDTKYVNKFGYFRGFFMDVLDESKDYEYFKNKLKSYFLNKVDELYKENNYSKEVELMLKESLDYLLENYRSIFFDCLILLKENNFLSKISSKIVQLYCLDLLNFEKVTEMKKELEIIINENYVKIPEKN